MFLPPLGGRHFFTVAQTHKNTVQGARTSGVALIFPELAVKLTDGDIGIAAVIVLYPFQFLSSMGVRMRGNRTMGPTDKGFPGPVKAAVPAHEGSLGDMIPTADVGNVSGIPIGFDGMIAGNGLMGEVTAVFY